MSNNINTDTREIDININFPVGILQILLIALKITNIIDWSWWWVLSPMIVALSIGLLILTLTIVVYIINWRDLK